MNLEDLKRLLGLSMEDTSKDAILQLNLDAALDQARIYANKYDFDGNDPLPSTIKLGIVRWVELALKRGKESGIASKSMAGMSVTYRDTGDREYFHEAFQIWSPFRKKGLVYRSAKRKDRGDIYANIPEDVTITGTRKL